MELIASSSNSRFKYVRRIQNDRRFRRREGQFAVETNRWLKDALAQGLEPSLLLCTDVWAKTAEGSDFLAAITGVKLGISPALLKELSGTQTPAGFIALLPLPIQPQPTNPTLLLILDQLRDPGNLGTIIRTAVAADVSALILTPGSVDPYNPKVVRSTMGTLGKLPILELNWGEIDDLCAGMPIYLAAGTGAIDYDAIDWGEPAGVIIGGEAEGVSAEARQRATSEIKIAMANGVESLNAAIATTVVLFEAARQRRLRD